MVIDNGLLYQSTTNVDTDGLYVSMVQDDILEIVRWVKMSYQICVDIGRVMAMVEKISKW